MTDAAKAGWVYKQSSILKRWKKVWLALSRDGVLREFDSPDDHIAKSAIVMADHVQQIKLGREAGETSAPQGLSADHLVKLVMTKGSGEHDWTLCCEDVDTQLAWQLALEQARVLRSTTQAGQVPAIPPFLQETFAQAPEGTYPMYYGSGADYPGQYLSRIVFTPSGQPITVVYVPYYYRNNGGDDGLGFLGGVALASLFMWPLFWPICFWH